jgi:hypothetical protein
MHDVMMQNGKMPMNRWRDLHGGALFILRSNDVRPDFGPELECFPRTSSAVEQVFTTNCTESHQPPTFDPSAVE